MKVIELIEMLNKFDPNMSVIGVAEIESHRSVSICSGAHISVDANEYKVAITLSGEETDWD